MYSTALLFLFKMFFFVVVFFLWHSQRRCPCSAVTDLLRTGVRLQFWRAAAFAGLLV
uniref:Uncharacterized protein n=1 Tax=Anguilla anguilla TaxID=7936 RepID=A0A0E9X7Y6_ANGAN